MSGKRVPLLVLAGLALTVTPLAAEDLSYQGWGPRVGLADDPDQIVVGVHFDLGEFADQVRFVPNAEIGFGDDHEILAFNAPVHYRWERLRETDIVPYAGAGLTAALVHRDDEPGRDDDTDFELGLRAIGGAEWRLKHRRTFLVELNLVFGDVHDIQVLAGWTFRP